MAANIAITGKIDSGMKAAIDAKTAASGKTKSQILNEALEQYLIPHPTMEPQLTATVPDRPSPAPRQQSEGLTIEQLAQHLGVEFRDLGWEGCRWAGEPYTNRGGIPIEKLTGWVAIGALYYPPNTPQPATGKQPNYNVCAIGEVVTQSDLVHALMLDLAAYPGAQTQWQRLQHTAATGTRRVHELLSEATGGRFVFHSVSPENASRRHDVTLYRRVW